MVNSTRVMLKSALLLMISTNEETKKLHAERALVDIVTLIESGTGKEIAVVTETGSTGMAAEVVTGTTEIIETGIGETVGIITEIIETEKGIGTGMMTAVKTNESITMIGRSL